MKNLESKTDAGRVRAPVFIVGAPRGGTTLLRVILNRHPQLAMWGFESQFLRRVYDRRAAFGDPGELRNRARAVDAYLAIGAVRGLKIDVHVLRERMMREGVSWPALFGSMLQSWADQEGKPYGGEKTPQHALHAKTLCEWYPNGSIIHLVRDPRAMLGALRRLPLATHSASRAAKMWRSLNGAARAASVHRNYLLVKYESFVSRPEEELRRICFHAGLEYHDAMLRPDSAGLAPRPEHHRSYQGVTSARIDLWREELQPWEVRVVEAIAGQDMEEYGYLRESAGVTSMDHARAAAEALFENSLMAILRSPRLFYGLFQPMNLADEEKWMALVKRKGGRLFASRSAGS